MPEHIKNWAAWRKGKIDSFHKYDWYNGEKYIQCERQSLQLAKTVCEAWANLLFSERCMISVDGVDISTDDEITSATALYVKNVFDSNNLWDRISEAQELKCSYGTVVYIPRAKNVDIAADNRFLGGGGISTDIITADMLIPLSWENGVITEIAVASNKTIKREDYVYIQLFTLEKGLYVIQNKLLKITGSQNYQAIDDITKIPGFERVAAKISTESKIKPFVIDKPNIANNIDPHSPLGISVYANAMDAMKQCDLTFDSLATEIALGRTRLFAAPGMIKNENGKPYFDPRDVMFQFIPLLGAEPDSVNKQIQTVQPQLRVDELEAALQLSLNTFSSLCGLGENYYRFNSGRGSIMTATQVMSELSVAFRTKTKHERVLEAALYDLVRLIIDIGVNTLKIKGLTSEPNIKILFEDSIIEDSITLKKQDLLEVSQGVMKLWEYRVKWFGETEEQAKTALGITEEEVETEPDNQMQAKKFAEPTTPSAGRLEQKINKAIPK